MLKFQENLKSLFDPEAFQAQVKQFYDVEALQANLAQLYNVDAVKAQFDQVLNGEALNATKEALESVVDFSAAEKGAELAGELLTVNTKIAADVATAQTTQWRDGVAGALEQVNVLLESKDVEAAVTAQKVYAEGVRNSLTENFAANVDALNKAAEVNVELFKSAFAAFAPAKQAA